MGRFPRLKDWNKYDKLPQSPLSKKEVYNALENDDPDMILGQLSQDEVWHLGGEWHRCPLCGYETTATNICRSCTEAPLTTELSIPCFCETHGIIHTKLIDGKKIPFGHASLPMYVLRLDGLSFRDWLEKQGFRYEELLNTPERYIRENEKFLKEIKKWEKNQKTG